MLRVLASILILSYLASCSSWTPFPTLSKRAVVHQGWDARYKYDEKKRRLHPYYGNRRVGRSVGRDEQGNVDYKVWWRNQLFNTNILKQDRP